MSSEKMNTILFWFACFLLVFIGIMNIVWVHSLPGMLYLSAVLVLNPAIHKWLTHKWALEISTTFRWFLFLLIFWMTLGVGDLMELFEGYWLRGEKFWRIH